MLEKHISYISGGPFDDTFVSLNCVREALGIIDEDTDILRTIRKLREERDTLKEKYDRLYISYEKTYRAKFTDLSEERDRYKRLYKYLKKGILELYREIFDCSNSDPERSDEEVLQDILTGYKRTLALKNTAEEKTIKYKELARENEDKANKYKIRLGNAERQLRWTEEVSSERLKKCEDLTRERENARKMEQKLSEIKDICER